MDDLEMRGCARPGCPSVAEATLTFRYRAREVALGPLSAVAAPEAYDLCAAHADRTRPPYGWSFADGREEALREPVLAQEW
jgi:hypothetical protein